MPKLRKLLMTYRNAWKYPEMFQYSPGNIRIQPKSFAFNEISIKCPLDLEDHNATFEITLLADTPRSARKYFTSWNPRKHPTDSKKDLKILGALACSKKTVSFSSRIKLETPLISISSLERSSFVSNTRSVSRWAATVREYVLTLSAYNPYLRSVRRCQAVNYFIRQEHRIVCKLCTRKKSNSDIICAVRLSVNAMRP